jgi:hypothetical protein
MEGGQLKTNPKFSIIAPRAGNPRKHQNDICANQRYLGVLIKPLPNLVRVNLTFSIEGMVYAGIISWAVG